MKKINRKILVILGVSFFLVIGILVALRTALNSSSTKNTTYTVKRETFKNEISIAGTVSAAHEQKLQALGNGTVVGVFAQKGDTVKKGDIIVQLDDSTEQYNLEKLDYDMAKTKITGSAREYQLMQKERQAVLQKIRDRKVTATFSGVIADLQVSIGDALEAKDSIGTLVDTSYLKAEVEIAETDVAKLQVGQIAKLRFPAFDGDVQGYVKSWPAIGEISSRGATIVKAELRIEEFPKVILPNYSFAGTIKIADDAELLIVEKYAIGYENGNAFVELAKGGKKIPVKAKTYASEFMQITEGLTGGEVLKAQSVPRQSGRIYSSRR